MQDSSGSSDATNISSASASLSRAKHGAKARVDAPVAPVAPAGPAPLEGAAAEPSGPAAPAVVAPVVHDPAPIVHDAAPIVHAAAPAVLEDPVAPAPQADFVAPAAPTAEAGLFDRAFAPAPVFQGAPGGHANVGGGVVYYAPLNLGPADVGYGQRNILCACVVWLFRTLADMVRFFVLMLKYPAILLVTCYISLLAMGYLVDTATDTLAPVCAFFPRFYPCRATASVDAISTTFGNVGRKLPVDIRRIDFPGLMDLQSRTLDQLLAHSSAGTHLALGVKHAELAVKDLGIMVKASNLTSRDVLARFLQEFAQDAKVTGRELQHLSAKMYGAVDRYVLD